MYTVLYLDKTTKKVEDLAENVYPKWHIVDILGRVLTHKSQSLITEIQKHYDAH